jgi:integrase/recombinase XerD
MAEITPLRRRMIEDMQVRNLSPVTQRCYVHAVTKFARHFNRSPDRLGLAEIRAYQIHLTTTGISWAGFNVAVCALRLFYGVTLGRIAMVKRIPYAVLRWGVGRQNRRSAERLCGRRHLQLIPASDALAARQGA